VVALDEFNNVVPYYTGTVRFSSSDPTAVLPPEHAFFGDNGIHTFTSGVMFNDARRVATLRVTDTAVGIEGDAAVALLPPAHGQSASPSIVGAPVISFTNSSRSENALPSTLIGARLADPRGAGSATPGGVAGTVPPVTHAVALQPDPDSLAPGEKAPQEPGTPAGSLFARRDRFADWFSDTRWAEWVRLQDED
jgi:hypothetical protein